jgi:DNA adenine methylase
MIVYRAGNKRVLAKSIIQYFPQHEIYIEPFFGTGSIFFQKKRVKYNFLNDLDEHIINFYTCLNTDRDRLYSEIENMPIHQSIVRNYFNYDYKDEYQRAAAYLYRMNYAVYGTGSATMKLGTSNSKERMLDYVSIYMKDPSILFTNLNYIEMFSKLSFDDSEVKKIFVYCDPPYLDTTHKAYFTKSRWKKTDLEKLIETLQTRDVKFAISEFKSKDVLDIITKYDLHYVSICERINIKNRNEEILIMNYQIEKNTTEASLF